MTIKLNIGSGCVSGTPFVKSDWLNIDNTWTPEDEGWPKGGAYQNFDIRESWPIEDDSVECIFASHIIEHIKYDELLLVFSECHRVLKEGHPIRIVCPDPRAFIENWRNKNFQFVIDSYDGFLVEGNNYANNLNKAYTDMFFHDPVDHWLVCCPDLLTMFLIRSGFPVISEMKYGSTRFQQYFGQWIVRNDNPPDKSLDNRPAMSFYLEAIK